MNIKINVICGLMSTSIHVRHFLHSFETDIIKNGNNQSNCTAHGFACTETLVAGEIVSTTPNMVFPAIMWSPQHKACGWIPGRNLFSRL